jgi:hypothetical protein
VLDSLEHRIEPDAESEGVIPLSVRGDTVAAAFTAWLESVLVAAGAGSTGSARYAPIRAEAADLPSLLIRITDAMLDESENLAEGIASVSVDGVVRSEAGYIAWGVFELAFDAMVSAPRPSVAGLPRVAEAPGSVVIEGVVRSGR